MPGPALQQTKPTKQAAPPKLPVYLWKAKSKNGEEKSGEMEAQSREAVENRLKQMGLAPTRVKKKPAELKIPGLGGASKKDLVVFTRQFCTMIDAGLPLVQALEILSTQAENVEMRKVLAAVKARVESGSTFAEALAQHPKIFDELYVQLCAAGEIGGILDTILNRLAVYIEKNEKLKSKVKGAMVYPAIVLVVAILCIAVLLLFVTPTFEKMFKDMGGTLPGPTQLIIDISQWLQDFIVPMIVVIVGGAVGFRTWIRSKRGKELWDSFVIKTPVFGPLIRKVAVARFTRTLGTMISSGVPILDALDVTAKTAGNTVVVRGIELTRRRISEGKTIAEPLAESGVFPPMVVQMIGVGEATGAMDAMLAKIADFYDEEVDAAVAALTSMLEPVMMVFLGGIVGFFLIAMYLPIFSMADNIK
jgi:type IV pilus assembly protein PilC